VKLVTHQEPFGERKQIIHNRKQLIHKNNGCKKEKGESKTKEVKTPPSFSIIKSLITGCKCAVIECDNRCKSIHSNRSGKQDDDRFGVFAETLDTSTTRR
jgi:hypothetical protein